MHPILRQILSRDESQFIRIRRSDRVLALPLGLLDTVLRTKTRSLRLKRLIENRPFDFVHLMETQHAGYIFNYATRETGQVPITALSVWGSDFVWFQKFENHRLLIQELLKKVSCLFTECSRDQAIARNLGFSGTFAERFSAGGGVARLEERNLNADDWSPTTRRAIVVKGYTGFVGKALLAVRAIVENADLLRNYEIHIHSLSIWMIPYLRVLALRYNLRIIGYRKKSLGQHEVLGLLRRARISLSVSLTGGLTGSSREAAWTGAFPIESHGSCVGDWFVDGYTCLLVNPNEICSVSSALRRALLDDDLVEAAARLNYELSMKFSTEEVGSKALHEYELLMNRTLTNGCQVEV